MLTIDVIYAPTTRQISLPDNSDFYGGATIDSNSVEISVTGIDAASFTSDLMVRIDFAVNLLVCGNKTVRPFLILEHVDDAWRGVVPVDVLRGAAKLKKLPFQLVLRDGDITINSKNTLTLGVNRAIDAMGTLWKVYYPYIMLRDDSWAWLPNFTYTVGSVVTYEGHMYVSKVDENRGNAPILPDDPTQSDDPFWKINIGPPGPQGPPGELVDGGDMVVRYIGDDVNTTYVVPHNLGTSKLIYSMQKDGKFIDASVSANPDDPNSLIVSFTEPPGFNKVIMTIYSGYATKVYDILPEEGEYQGELIYYTPDKTIRYWADDTWLILLQKRYFDIHLGDHNNPHHVTKAQVGLDQVDNTSDEDKPLSRASREAFAQEKEEREEADERLRFDLNAEIQARTEADDLLGRRIDNEARERAEADTAIQNRLSQEIQDREDADAALQKAIDDEVARSTAKDTEHDQAIAKEIQDRKDADAALQNAIDNEAAARIAGDEALQNAIDTEIERSIAKDEELERLIDEEASARQEADEALTQALATETRERKAQDAILQGEIEDEVAMRTSEIVQVYRRIDEEVTKRKEDDTALNKLIIDEEKYRKAADKALQDNIDAEAAARRAGDQLLEDKKVNRAGDTMTGTLVLAKEGPESLYIDNRSRDMVEGTESYFSAIHFRDGGTTSRPPADCSMLASSSVKDATTGVVRTDTYLYSMNTNKSDNSPSNAALHLIAGDDGTSYATAPATPSTATGNEIATANWVLSVMDPSSPEWMDELDNKVNKTGDTMTGALTIDSNNHKTITIKNSTANVSTGASSEHRTMYWADTSGKHTGLIRNSVTLTDNAPRTNIEITTINYNESGNTLFSAISVYCHRDGTKYATAPSPSDKNDNSMKIATTAWVNQTDFLVHTTGAETIDGQKTFTGNVILSNPSVMNQSILIKNNYNLSDKTASGKTIGAIIIECADSDTNLFYNDYFVTTEYHRSRMASRFLDNSGVTNGTHYIELYANADGTGYATAPATPDSATENEIATAGWVIAKDNALQANIDGKVSKSGDTMTGALMINTIGGSAPIIIRNPNIVTGTPATTYKDIRWCPNDSTNEIGLIRCGHTSDGEGYLRFRAFNTDATGSNDVYLRMDLNGTTTFIAPTPSDSADNSGKVATTSWVNTASSVVHKTSNETISGEKTFTGVVYLNGRYGGTQIRMDNIHQSSSVPGQMITNYIRAIGVTKNGSDSPIWQLETAQLTNGLKRIILATNFISDDSGTNSWKYPFRIDERTDKSLVVSSITTPSDATGTEIATANWVIAKLSSGTTDMATVKRGQITGNGTTTAFTFQHGIVSTSVVVQVYLDGVLVQPGVTLTEGAVTLTFSTAPPQGEVYDIAVMG